MDSYLIKVQRRFLADLRIQPGTISETIIRHRIPMPEGFDARGHSSIVRGLRAAGAIVAVKVDRSASPTAHHGYVTRWCLVRGEA
jgi:hypothetical protein